MQQKEVLVTDYVHPVLLKGLDTLGFSYTYAPEMTKREMESVLPFYNGVVINTRCGLDEEHLHKATRLRWIARLGSGLDIIDLKSTEKLNITVISTPEANAQAVAEHSMAMLLCLSNQLIKADRSVREDMWLREEHRGWEVSGKTIGIIGYGNNGSAFGKLWKGWDVHVLAYDKYLKNYGNEQVTATERESLLQQADVISLHIPLTEETTGMVNEEFLHSCKAGAVLINTSRGKIVDLQAVLKALKSGKLKGFCADVLPFEPPARGDEDFKSIMKELYAMDNVVLSPHIAGWTHESKEKISSVLLEKITSLKQKERL